MTPLGKVISFYSYKGGVGRSMAVANLAEILVDMGYTTLVVDWDLEAPGIERYFAERHRLDLDAIKERPGVCDIIARYVNSPEARGAQAAAHYPDVRRHIHEVFSRGDTRLYLMTAGRRTRGVAWESYAAFVQSFDWAGLYDHHEGGAFLDWMLLQFREIAPITLVDSRTGVTEMGGVATQHLADGVVLLTGANSENIENTAAMARSFLSDSVRTARGGRPLEVLIVPSRIDDADSTRFSEFKQRLQRAFADVPTWDRRTRHDMMSMLLPYLAHCSYREVIVVGDSELESPSQRLVDAYRRIAANVKLFADPDGSLLKGWLQAAGSKATMVGVIYHREDKTQVDEIATALERTSGAQLIHIDISRDQPDDPSRDLLLRSDLVLVVLSRRSAVADRLRSAVALALEGGKRVIPLLLEDVEMPFELASFQPIAPGLGRQEVLAQLRAVISSGPSEREKAREPYVFLSHASEEAGAAQSVLQVLESAGIPVWSAARDIPAGASWLEAVQAAAEDAAAMVVLLSGPSVSPRQLSEITLMSRLERPVVPVALKEGVDTPLFGHLPAIGVGGDIVAAVRKALESPASHLVLRSSLAAKLHSLEDAKRTATRLLRKMEPREVLDELLAQGYPVTMAEAAVKTARPGGNKAKESGPRRL